MPLLIHGAEGITIGTPYETHIVSLCHLLLPKYSLKVRLYKMIMWALYNQVSFATITNSSLEGFCKYHCWIKKLTYAGNQGILISHKRRLLY